MVNNSKKEDEDDDGGEDVREVPSVPDCEKPTTDTGMHPVAKRFTKITAVDSILGFWIDYSEGTEAEVM